MPWSGRNIFWRPLGRRLFACLALLSYVTTALGFPLPAPSQKQSDQPFPCQNHPCGCQSAEQCWRHCCCFTPEQRLAWAREHKVKPPEYAEKPAPQGWHTVRLRDRDKASAKPHAATSCCTAQSGTKPCCQQASSRKTSARAAARPKSDSRSQPKPGLRWSLGLAAQHCQGLSTLWVSTGTVLPPGPPLTWNPYPAALGWLSFPDAFPAHHPPSPPDRPPRSPFA
jgi:hypothetical protein